MAEYGLHQLGFYSSYASALHFLCCVPYLNMSRSWETARDADSKEGLFWQCMMEDNQSPYTAYHSVFPVDKHAQNRQRLREDIAQGSGIYLPFSQRLDRVDQHSQVPCDAAAGCAYLQKLPRAHCGQSDQASAAAALLRLGRALPVADLM